MKRLFILSLAAVFLFGAVDVQGTSVNCDSVDAVKINISINDISDWNSTNEVHLDLWALNHFTGVNSSCRPYFSQETGSVEYGPFHVSDCADNATKFNDSLLEYEFIIGLARDDYYNSSSPVIYQPDRVYVITCYYNRQQQNVFASFEPGHVILQTNHSDEGDLNVAFKLYRTAGQTEITSGQVIDLTTSFYGKIYIVNAGSTNLNLHIDSVKASSDNVGSNSLTLVTDGCPEDNGVVDSVECDNNPDERFQMKTNGAFRFPNQMPGDKVYFTATVTICLASDSSAECTCANCGSRRKRRDAIQESVNKKYYVSAGPYRIRSSNEESAVDKNEQVNEGTAFPSYMIAVVAVCGVVAIAIICGTVLIVLRRRPRNSLTAESRDAETKQTGSYEQEVPVEYSDTFAL